MPPSKDCFKNVLKLMGYGIVGLVAMLTAFPLLFVPGNCESSPGFCGIWEIAALLVISPFYTGIAALFLSCAQSPRWVKIRGLLWKAIIILPAAGSVFYWLAIFAGSA